MCVCVEETQPLDYTPQFIITWIQGELDERQNNVLKDVSLSAKD